MERSPGCNRASKLEVGSALYSNFQVSNFQVRSSRGGSSGPVFLW
jgi:hypothetical protein